MRAVRTVFGSILFHLRGRPAMPTGELLTIAAVETDLHPVSRPLPSLLTGEWHREPLTSKLKQRRANPRPSSASEESRYSGEFPNAMRPAPIHARHCQASRGRANPNAEDQHGFNLSVISGQVSGKARPRWKFQLRPSQGQGNRRG